VDGIANLPDAGRMPLYFFDTRDDDTFVSDDDGVELPNIEAVKGVAAASLAELARDVLPGSTRRNLAVEVRQERQPVRNAVLAFEAVVLA
jgi:hypothetical protein